MKYASIDCEATGINYELCDILEIGVVLDDLEDPKPIQDLPKFQCYFIPTGEGGTFRGEPYGMYMNAEILRKIDAREEPYDYYSPNKVGHKLKTFFLENGYEAEGDRVYVNAAGKNFGIYDYQLIKNKTDILKHIMFRHMILDPGPYFLRPEDDRVPGMEVCLERAGLDSFVTHNAVDDAIQVVQLVRTHMLGYV